MSKRPQRGTTCQQQQQSAEAAAAAAERQEGQPASGGHAELKQAAPNTSENLDDHKRTMTSQTRKRPRLSVPTGEQIQGAEGRLDEPRPLEQQAMIDFSKGGELVQELRLPMRGRNRTQQPNKPASSSASPPQSGQGGADLAPDQTEAPKCHHSPRPLTAANASPARPKEQNICAACKRPIRERYLLMALDKHWHEDCLKCACCDCRLGEVGSSLFTHSDKILCRRDFLRIFGQHGHCAACKRSIPPYELVMRANELAYHMDCFACQQCQYRFCVGDRFYLAEAHKITCLRCHSEQPPPTPTTTTTTTTSTGSTTPTTTNTTTTTGLPYDQNHIRSVPDCTTATSTGSPAAAPTAMGRLDPFGLTVCPPRPGDAFGGQEDVEPKLAAARDDQLEGGAAGQIGSERKVTPPQQQQQVAAAAAAAAKLQPGDQKQACAV